MLHNLFYFPQNAIYFIILSFSVQIILMFFLNHALKFKNQPGHLKGYQSTILLLLYV